MRLSDVKSMLLLWEAQWNSQHQAECHRAVRVHDRKQTEIFKNVTTVRRFVIIILCPIVSFYVMEWHFWRFEFFDIIWTRWSFASGWSLSSWRTWPRRRRSATPFVASATGRRRRAQAPQAPGLPVTTSPTPVTTSCPWIWCSPMRQPFGLSRNSGGDAQRSTTSIWDETFFQRQRQHKWRSSQLVLRSSNALPSKILTLWPMLNRPDETLHVWTLCISCDEHGTRFQDPCSHWKFWPKPISSLPVHVSIFNSHTYIGDTTSPAYRFLCHSLSLSSNFMAHGQIVVHTSLKAQAVWNLSTNVAIFPPHQDDWTQNRIRAMAT